MENDDNLNMDFVYDAMDLFKRAIVATREVEVITYKYCAFHFKRKLQ